MAGHHPDRSLTYDGRVPTNRSWWKWWIPQFHHDLWKCEFCHKVYFAFDDFHEHGRDLCTTGRRP